MATYRMVSSKIWEDPDFEEYPQRQKYLFVFLITNKLTSESGIYPISPKSIKLSTDLELDEITEYLGSTKNISYDFEKKVVFLHNFLKYNRQGRPDLKAKAIAREYLETGTALWLEWLVFYHRTAFAKEMLALLKASQGPLFTNPKLLFGPLPFIDIDMVIDIVIDILPNISPYIKQRKVKQPLTTKPEKSDNSHDNGRIKTEPPILAESDPLDEKCKLVISYLNKTCGKKYSNGEHNLEHIRARLRSGHSVEQCKLVIDIKCEDDYFQNNPKYLNPQTLFRPKNFERYLNEIPVAVMKQSTGLRKLT